MATLYVTEYQGYEKADIPVAVAPGLASQTVAITGASVQSAPFNALTGLIRVHPDSICSIAISSNPTATVTVKRMAASQTEYWSVTPGHKIAVIANT
jgi:hypothetical protein